MASDVLAVGACAAAACGRAVARARPGRRLSVFLAAYLLLTAAMCWRLVSVQVVQAAEYRGLAERQTQRELELPARRGRLYDRDGDPLAMSLAASTIYANPQILRDARIDPMSVAVQLAPVLGRPADELAPLLRRDAQFVFLGRQLPRQVGEQVVALDLPGVGVVSEPTRVYPGGSLAAQVVGFAGIDNTGLAGLEDQYDDLLAGSPGQLRLERAPGGVTISAAPREVLPATPGTDLVLTLDRQIQHHAEEALATAVEDYGAEGGSAVVLDARSGEILALASVPGFASEDIGRADSYARRNRALTDVFEPGSVNKVITVAGAIEEGVVSPGTTFTVPYSYEIEPETFRDSARHETEVYTVAGIIERSSNVGTIQIAEHLGARRLHDYVTRFGLGGPTGLGFPGESEGILADVEDWTNSSLPTIAIGQGVSATLLQVAQVFGVVASGGEWVEPSLVRGTVGPDGSLSPVEAAERRRVVSETTADAVSDMLERVVDGEQGTGALAAVPGYDVGGKTGTAQKAYENRRGYEPGAYIASFVGFAPVDDPALVVAVMLDEPGPVYYGGSTAAPVFSDIMAFALSDRRIPPSAAPAVPEPAASATPGSAGATPSPAGAAPTPAGAP
jgi:cell division protein FtsI (penicillin-binding protein 3)